MTWFEQLFGFREASYETTRAKFSVDGGRLRSLVNGASFAIGAFHTPTLASLHADGHKVGRRGSLAVRHEVVTDALLLHALPTNRGALFQVASQLNCLEFVGPSVVPEDGVTGYADDRTQGPACSLAAAAATVYRNYFAPVEREHGQTRDRQINTLDDLAAVLGEPDRFWKVRNGYTFSTSRQLAELASVLAQHDREHLMSKVKIGIQTGAGVTFADRFTRPPDGVEPIVSQAFCSALSCAYSGLPVDEWEPLATLVLDAAYEVTLWAAVVNATTPLGTNTVWLTFLGGGVFGNRPEWIHAAIRRAVARVQGFALDVRIAHYRGIDRAAERAIEL